MYKGDFDYIQQESEVKGLNDDIEKYNIDTSYSDIEFRRARNNYNRITTLLSQTNYKDPDTYKTSKIKFKELKELLIEILDLIFDKKYHKEIDSYNKDLLQLSIEDLKEWDNAVSYYISKDKFITTDIQISKRLTKIEVPFVAHEYIHVLLGKFQTLLHRQVLNNFHYDELLSIIVEYITSYELDQIDNEHLLDKDNLIRLNHNKSNIMEYNAAQRLKLVEKFDEETKQDEKYLNHILYQYLICDIYASRILDIYKDDKKDVIGSIIAILEGESSIEELKKRYNISLSDMTTRDTYINKLTNPDWRV